MLCTSPVDWNHVLIPNAPLKLLYSLNLIDKYVTAGTSPTGSPTSQERLWCDAFLAKGGVAHLIKVLMTCDVDALLASALPKSCLILTLKLVCVGARGWPRLLSHGVCAVFALLLVQVLRSPLRRVCKRPFCAVAVTCRPAAAYVHPDLK